ncbi:transcriptional regulator, SARP family [Beutenbergia cavernae DSM 12333]|uniref:Transcriptional regulator, SARP family n=1 Tax=Beutenbergia cavernae (strain ATCC BAA-8 / DSM 12333 / CCUG 43141 / JCM 11478 / NBRC 16432 / NCIMB 13614 / HKI 0122) TaxID=471853 RepID=C5C015_BEUC1|nr:AfsR/SARP family transcriptional regulator [Beutenbergia cavernae]ACQ81345.1 transcriptional regulator, SARP family [Beutenbergia cavernae DSM 12333]
MLGPLVVTQDGEDVALPAGRSVQLVALLAVAAPDPVSADRLLEALWDDGGGTRGALQVLVHRVRRRLGEGAVESVGQSYRLGAAELVAEDFALRAGHARDRVDVAPREALAELDAALRLWRGEPFGELAAASPELAAESARLSELHVDALEARFEAALTAGMAGELVPDLRDAVAAHPLRERLHAHLMLALYRAGRTAAALDAYRAARGELVGELGLEPGPLLKDLERAILLEDPVLAAPPAPLTGPERPVRPAQLPGPDPAFTGRPEEVDLLARELRSGSSLVAVAGPGGAGKSALALEVANAVADAFPGGQLYVDLRGAMPDGEPRGVEEVLERFLRALGLPRAPSDPEEAAAELRTRTALSPVLVVLDDAASLAQVRPLLPSAPSAAIVTSRPVLGLPISLLVHLDELSDVEALEMLARAAGEDRVRAEEAAARRIVDACGRLPLALRIAGARLAAAPHRRLAVLADRLGDERHRLDELRHGDLAVRASIAVGLRGLDPLAPRMLAALGVLDMPSVSPVAAARLADVPLAVARRRLDDLAEARLLVTGADESVTMHELVRFFASERAGVEFDDDERAALVRRGYEHYLASVRAASHAFTPDLPDFRMRVGPSVEPRAVLAVEFADAQAALAWVRTEIANLQAVVDGVARLPDGPELVAAMLAPLVRIFDAQALHGPAARMYAPVLERDAPTSPAEALVWADSVVVRQHDPANDDRLDAALEVLRSGGDARALATALNVRGIRGNRTGRFDRAAEAFAESIEILTTAGHDTAAAYPRTNLVDALTGLGRLDEAAAVAEANIASSTGMPRAITRCNLAMLRAGSGRLDEAHEQFREAARELRDSGDLHMTARCLWHDAAVLGDAGRTEEARQTRAEAVGLAVELGLLTPAAGESALADPSGAEDAFGMS